MKELKALENEYIDLIKFHFFVKKEDFDKYKLYIEDIEMESNKK